MPADYMTTESHLPFSLEAEQSVLGAALLDAGCVPDLVRLVRPEFFYPRSSTARSLRSISGKFTLGEPIDIVTVMEAAVREEIFSTPEETKAYLAQLAQMVPSVRNLEAYTNILQSKYHLRALITTSRDIIEQAEAPTAQPEGLLEYAEQRIYDIRNGHNNDSLIPVSRVVLETFDHLQRLSGENRADYLGISTGYGDLDRTITGLNKSDLILVAARPGMGKTAFALNIAANVALRGKGRRHLLAGNEPRAADEPSFRFGGRYRQP
ncbi:MAG: replicative DNA helicase [Angelakisella sp.]